MVNRIRSSTQVKIRNLSILISFLWLLLLSTSSQLLTAQNQLIPTLSPSKTPISTQESPQQIQLNRPFTQSDLTLLTGNIQRPNGIFWFNNHLYIACNGDFSVYQLNDSDGITMALIASVHNANTLFAEATDSDAPSLWIPDYQSNALVHIENHQVTIIASDLRGPWGIAYLDDTHFLVTNLLGNTLYIISRFGDKQEVLSNLTAPTGVTNDGEYVYIANNGSTRRAIEWYRISNLTDTGGETRTPDTQATNHILVSGLQNVTDLVLGSDGNLYFAYSLNELGVIGKVNPTECRENGGCTNDQIEIVLFTDLSAPLAGLTLRPDMRLYVHTMFNPNIYWIDLARG